MQFKIRWVPFRYRKIRFPACQCTEWWFMLKLPTSFTANAISSLVPRTRYNRHPTSCWYGTLPVISASFSLLDVQILYAISTSLKVMIKFKFCWKCLCHTYLKYRIIIDIELNFVHTFFIQMKIPLN